MKRCKLAERESERERARARERERVVWGGFNFLFQYQRSSRQMPSKTQSILGWDKVAKPNIYIERDPVREKELASHSR